MNLVTIDARGITDWDTFHDVFAEAFGFPDFYGCNMNAWIDCMTYLDDADAGMSKVQVPPGCVLVLELENVKEFALRCPEQYAAVIECSAFDNWRRIHNGDPAVICLSFQMV